MARLSLGDRLAAGAVGVFFGGLVGLALAWLLGVYSNTLGPSRTFFDFKQLVLSSAVGFGLVGLILGPFVGTLLGLVISGIFRFERAEESYDAQAPTWLVVVVVLAVVAAIWWSAT